VLTRDETLDLLSAAAAYDSRNPSDAQTMAWAEAARRGRWTFPEALDALHEHYATRTEFLMPGRITEAIKTRRSLPPRVVPASTPPPHRPASPERVSAILAELSRRLGWPPVRAGRSDALSRPCGHCGAKPGHSCTRPHDRGPSGRLDCRPHPSRCDPDETP
jgi:hypothetical protein